MAVKSDTFEWIVHLLFGPGGQLPFVMQIQQVHVSTPSSLWAMDLS